QDRHCALTVHRIRIPSSLLRLRENNNGRESLLGGPYRSGYTADLLFAIVAGGSRTVKEQDNRERFVALVIVGHKDHVLRFPSVTLVNAVEEAVFDRVRSVSGGQCQAEQTTESQHP